MTRWRGSSASWRQDFVGLITWFRRFRKKHTFSQQKTTWLVVFHQPNWNLCEFVKMGWTIFPKFRVEHEKCLKFETITKLLFCQWHNKCLHSIPAVLCSSLSNFPWCSTTISNGRVLFFIVINPACEPRIKHSYFPWNTPCLVGILISCFMT